MKKIKRMVIMGHDEEYYVCSVMDMYPKCEGYSVLDLRFLNGGFDEYHYIRKDLPVWEKIRMVLGG